MSSPWRVVTLSETSPDVLELVYPMVVDAFEGDFSTEDWEHTHGGWRVVIFDAATPVAHAAVVPRIIRVGDQAFQTGYVEGVATHPARQRAGLGSLVMTEATRLVRAHFEMGALSTDRPTFYARLGWELWHGPTFVQDGPTRQRTDDEDGGIMVLRHGASADVDLTAPIACEPRSGDDW